MGMYTAFRIQCELKKEFIPVIENLYKLRYGSKYDGDVWASLSMMYPQYNQLSDYSYDEWASFIPFGQGDFEFDSFDNEGIFDNIWQFSCSLKNYEHTIEHFLKKIIFLMAERVIICESWYCEDKKSYPYILYIKEG
jgi:hypothetical protein